MISLSHRLNNTNFFLSPFALYISLPLSLPFELSLPLSLSFTLTLSLQFFCCVNGLKNSQGKHRRVVLSHPHHPKDVYFFASKQVWKCFCFKTFFSSEPYEMYSRMLKKEETKEISTHLNRRLDPYVHSHTPPMNN